MLVQVVRRLTPEEVKENIKKFEHKCNMTFDEFKELFLKGRLNKLAAEDYYEWVALMDAYQGYMEEGELDYTVEELYTFTPEEMRRLTPKRLELLYTLAHLHVDSISNLARKVRRDVKNIYQDLQILKKLELVTLNRRGKRNIIPETLVEKISFLIG
jgi:DNA-binding transcriptional ArsR family regulator